MASSEVDDAAASNQVDCTIDMLIAAASQQSTVSIIICDRPVTMVTTV